MVSISVDCFYPVIVLNRPQSNIEDRSRNTVGTDNSAPVKLDAAAQAHIEKHRYLLHLTKFWN